LGTERFFELALDRGEVCTVGAVEDASSVAGTVAYGTSIRGSQSTCPYKDASGGVHGRAWDVYPRMEHDVSR
jgi:hypothetical protein